eukprot:CAMPEP_0202688208 /NCGR_PEP_ID=MMETSP1385-20130828/3735_1 /ASSEMBLY_ACC=CAM_ASM_000861 /TAXON_ID=933848 /ORGANISM="Elphidium margaritaceum" /LENGTH=362 /DNA_ID=CAMNT_0049343121 /DNA_START=105 /DNA_END=1190 /DNA_ORIENTATION=-
MSFDYFLMLSWAYLMVAVRVNAGSWKLILSQEVDPAGGTGYFPVTLITDDYSQTDPSINPFSIINAIDPENYAVGTNAAFQFRLRYNDGYALSNGNPFDMTWTQESWLTQTSIIGSSLGDHSNECGVFRGLARSDADVYYLDGNGQPTDVTFNCRYFSVGLTQSAFDTGYYDGYMITDPANAIPNAIYATKAELYICTDAECDDSSPIITSTATCDESSIATFDWDDLMTSGTAKPEVVAFDMNVDETDLSLNIEVQLTLEGRSSADVDDAIYGTTYVLDFEDFDAHADSIAQPGTCQNRDADDFTGAFDTFWEYSLSPVDDIGTAPYLAYPPPGDLWTVSMASDNECGAVVYTGKFTWNDL